MTTPARDRRARRRRSSRCCRSSTRASWRSWSTATRFLGLITRIDLLNYLRRVVVSIVLGRLASVDLVMVRNGRAKVDITFTEEGACTKAGATCRIASECCSRKCTEGLCAAAEEAPMGSGPKVLP